MATQFGQNIQLPYSNFRHAANILDGIAPIDYFLAVEVTKAYHQSAEESSKLLRAEAELLFHIVVFTSQKLRDGHTCLPLEVAAHVKFGFGVDEQGIVTHQGYVFPNVEILEKALRGFEPDIQQDTQQKNQLLVYRNKKVYLKRYADFESELEGFIAPKIALDTASLKYDIAHIAQAINLIFPETNETSTIIPKNEIDWQKVAVANALNKEFSIIAGGPGTGKTYTVTKLLTALMLIENQSGRNPTIKLTAPTGKAAQRLSESIIDAVTGFKKSFADTPVLPVLDKLPTTAETLHRLLGVIPNSPNFRHDQTSPLALDILLIDEVSMVDLPMMTRVFRALPPYAKVILLGDADQLPSVAAGSVLADLAPRPHHGYSRENISYLSEVIDDKAIEGFTASRGAPLDHVTLLLKSRRFDGKGIIGRVAKQVIEGEAKASWQLISEPLAKIEPKSVESTYLEQPNKVVIEPSNTQWLKGFVKQYYQPLFEDIGINQAFEFLAKFRILAATRQGEFGVEALNEAVKQHLISLRLVNPLKDMYQGLPIMITQNDYRIGLYNGDVGLIWRHDNGQLMAAFESENNEIRWVMPSRLPSYESVYAMTIHKTQGSEFGHVALVLPTQKDNKLLSRELLYTGITRAKTSLNIICRENVWHGAVTTRVERHSGLTITE